MKEVKEVKEVKSVTFNDVMSAIFLVVGVAMGWSFGEMWFL